MAFSCDRQALQLTLNPNLFELRAFWFWFKAEQVQPQGYLRCATGKKPYQTGFLP
ncbi:hypothetical protein [Methylomonas sp. LWB]|uniref:hypothetical protein n=1 Tax=unclassified Methylomonas TaxID=2608980 RepID=UPI00143B2C45|nr:hypothetical protein [Methylomonas sp. LWB]NJA08141.1 hypothetical protein [Methylococcaceae bacterium WWC4]